MTPSTKKEFLIEAVLRAKEAQKQFFAISVKMGGFPENEIIVNPAINMDDKLAYWCKTYNDDLVHNFSPSISVVSWVAGDSYAELQDKLR